jgi:menaquinone-dependent protoporphyrinogen oxidase
MRILITWGTKLGGTEGIARILGASLEAAGHEVTLRAARDVTAIDHDAVIVGGALYANRWHRDARRFVARHTKTLRRVPVWMFSSGPLDDSADRQDIAPTREVATLMERIGARGHATFGGRMPADARGIAAGMARTHSGDWRNPERIRTWAADIGRIVPLARPEPYIDHPGGRGSRIAVHAMMGWALWAVVTAIASFAPHAVALTVRAVAAPLIFAAIAAHYFGARGARSATTTALVMTAIVGCLDAVVFAGIIERSAAMFQSPWPSWVPLGLVFLATWITGGIIATLPWPRPPRHADHTPAAATSRA